MHVAHRPCAAAVFVAAISSWAAADEPAPPRVQVLAEATDANPRNSEGSCVELADGTLLLVWQEFRPGDGDSDFFPARLVSKTSRDGGLTWDDYRVVAEPAEDELSLFSPNLVRLPGDDLLLVFMRYYPVSTAKNKYPPTAATSWLSNDGGRSFVQWGQLWRESMNGFASSVVKRLSTGRIVVPVSRDLSQPGQADHWESGVVYSDDGGVTWNEGQGWIDLPLRGAMESHVEELRDGRLLMIVRTQLGAIFQAHSTDGGDTWSKPQTTGLRSPESCPDLVRIPATGDLLIVWNNAPYDPAYYSHFGKRTPLSLAVSRDEGLTWRHAADVETDAGWAFSNPGCCFTGRNTLVLNYWACRYQESGAMSNFPIHLKLAVVDLDWLYAEGMKDE
jgi:sialidase-1